MTATTASQGLPYPEPSDTVAEYPATAKALAELLDLVLPPVGFVGSYAGAAAPDGWFLCDGAEVDAASYPKLASVMGATGSTFRVPDLLGRFVLGNGDGAATSPRSIGQTGGAEDVAITQAQMPSHGHGVNDPGHLHGLRANFIGESAGMYHRHTDRLSGGDANPNAEYQLGTHSSGTGISIAGAGGNQAHTNMPPFYVLAFIIRHGEAS